MLYHGLITLGHFVPKQRGGGYAPPLFSWKGGISTATTYLKAHHISKGETIAQSLKDRFEYGQNPDKTEGGELISCYECDHMTADAEFLLSKAKYKAITGREQQRDADVLCYQIDHIKVYENGNISVRFKFADELRKIAEYIEINTTTDPAVAG